MVQHEGSWFKHDFATHKELKTCSERLSRNWNLALGFLPPYVLFYFVFTFGTNMLGLITGTSDANGNNFNNFFILFCQYLEIDGLFVFFNLFNFGGWLEAFFGVPYVWIFGWNLDLFIMLIELWTGAITAS